jgi:hypothetical protein
MANVRIGDRVFYRPIGHRVPMREAFVVLDIERKCGGPGVYSDCVTRIKIRNGRGGWVNETRITREVTR